jgi:protein SCO1/2
LPDAHFAIAGDRQSDSRSTADDTRWTFLTGDRATIYSLASDTFRAEAFRRSVKDRILHTEHFYFIDGERQLRGILNGTRLDVVEEAKKLFASSSLANRS